MSPLPASRGMYFDEFQVGQRVFTAARTVTESDVVNFAGVSGDFTQIHTDAEYTRTTAFGQRVAHGLLCLSIATGQVMHTGVLVGTVLAFREIKDWKFIKPVFLGDTIHTELEVIGTKALPPVGGGLVTLAVTIKNQAGETAMKGTWVVLMASKP